jgi:putative hydrolase
VDGIVDWSLAERTAREVAREGDRRPSADERTRLEEALRLAEHWLDQGGLPAPPDAGRTLVLDRDRWIDDAIVRLRRLVDPIAAAQTDAMLGMARRQVDELRRALDEDPDAVERALGELGDLEALGEDGLAGLAGLGLPGGMPGGLPGLGDLPEGLGAQAEAMREQLRRLAAEGGLADMVRRTIDAFSAGDPATMMRPAAATLTALQAGQVVGTLARQVLGHHDLGIATAPAGTAGLVAVNVAEAFDGYDLDPDEVAVVLAVTEAAHRRLHHAVTWLAAHVDALVARFAALTEIDEERMREVAEAVQQDLDPDDPASFARAIERAGRLRMRPSDAQRPVLARLQVVTGLVGAWARHEARAALDGRVPSLGRIEEVLRRRRATQGDGEERLAGLLGLELTPPDETVAERFVATVLDVLGSDGLRTALAHPEMLPDADELADPGAWLARTVEVGEVPDDVAGLLGEDGAEGGSGARD